MTDSTGTDEGVALDPPDAAAIMQSARERARHDLTVSQPAIFISGAVALLLGYGAIWLSVRGQRPYHGPTGATVGILLLLVAAAVVVTAVVRDRARNGVGGLSAVRMRMSSVSLVIAYLAVAVLETALTHDGAGRPLVHGVIQATAPVLVTGVFYMASSAMSLDWAMFGLGLWLVAVAVGGAFAGPVTVWAVQALAGGLAFLLVAVIRPRLYRP